MLENHHLVSYLQFSNETVARCRLFVVLPRSDLIVFIFFFQRKRGNICWLCICLIAAACILAATRVSFRRERNSLVFLRVLSIRKPAFFVLLPCVCLERVENLWFLLQKEGFGILSLPGSKRDRERERKENSKETM